MSDADVESYKQIKSDLDVLRQSVEKSELWVYKSNKPTAATVAAGGSQKLHNGSDEHQTSASITQIPMSKADSTTPIVSLSSVDANKTIPSQPIEVEGTHVAQPTNSTEKGSFDIFASDGSGGGVEEEFEDDEYKKIQKVTVSSDVEYIRIRSNLLRSQCSSAQPFEALLCETQLLLQIELFIN